MTSEPGPEQRIGHRPGQQPGGQPGRELDRHLAQQLDLSINALRRSRPDYSAHVTATSRQLVSIITFVVVVVALVVLWPVGTAQVLLGVLTLLYACAIAFRLWLVLAGSRGDHRISVSDDEALRVPADELPVYTVLVPAYREPSVIGELMAHLAALDYPTDKLDVQLLLEADDRETIAAAEAALPGPHVRIRSCRRRSPGPSRRPATTACASPGASSSRSTTPRTGPSRCSCAGRSWPFGSARPDARLRAGRAQLLQRRRRTGITRWFTLEYAMWFRSLLPGLVALGMPIPLGGTSQPLPHAIAARPGRRGIRTTSPRTPTSASASPGSAIGVGVLDSVTLEEANRDFVNWIKQRSRWYKGYLQTWLVHMRTPRTVVRQLGWRGFVSLNLFVGGTPLSTLVNPLFWGLTIIWLISQPPLVEQLFVAPVYYVGLVCMVFGNATVVYLNLLAARDGDRPDLLPAALTSPFYWLMMSVAAAKAAFQLVFQPTYWEKTTHGLNLAPARAHTGAENAD